MQAVRLPAFGSEVGWLKAPSHPAQL